MQIVMNDISFRYQFRSRKQAMDAVRKWLDVCRELKADRVTNVENMVVANIDRDYEIAPDYKWIQLLQDFRDIEDRRQLLTILQATDSLNEELEPFFMLGKGSQLCAYAYKVQGICISLDSRMEFRESLICGSIGGEEIQLNNIAEKRHINTEYAVALGIRIYQPNPKHSTNAYIRKGMEVSVMDLNDSEAQALLNKAIEIEGCYYAKYREKYYQFPKTRLNTYHGFRNDRISEDIKRKLDKAFI